MSMFGRKIKFNDSVRASIGERISSTTVKHPTMARFLHGTDDPTKVLFFKRVSTPRSTDKWVHFDGNSESGVRPVTYQTVGFMVVNLAALASAKAEHPTGRIAIAFALGSAAMAAEIPNQTFEMQSKPDQTEKCIGMKIGKGDLDMTCGIWLPDTRCLIVPDGCVRPTEGTHPVLVAETLGLGPIY